MAQISGERLQDYWSSGYGETSISSDTLIILYTSCEITLMVLRTIHCFDVFAALAYLFLKINR